MRSLNLISAALFLAALAANAQLATYSDPKTGVTFQYPAVWVSSDKAPSYMGPSITSDTVQPRASYTFTSDGNLYQKTLLLSLIFSYFVVPTQDAASCMALAKDATGTDSPPKTITNHNVQFQELDGGSAGMCHGQAEQIDTTYRNNQCFVFERDFNTECDGAGDHKRKLTAIQTKALQRYLDEIMQSVVFAPVKP